MSTRAMAQWEPIAYSRIATAHIVNNVLSGFSINGTKDPGVCIT